MAKSIQRVSDKSKARNTTRAAKKRTVKKPLPVIAQRIYKRKLALLLPGHNEEIIIATTIRSALAAGQKLEDIYVVDDCSHDKTRKEALTLLPKENVLTVKRSGKALAVQKGIKKFAIVQRYHWVHIADADSIFGENYFKIYRKNLNAKKYSVAVGFVQSLRGNWISTYRALNYTYSQHINRRIQSYLGMISVFPGPITCFKTSIISQLDFDTGSLTEDFDITLQVHRKKLGAIKYIPKAVNYTQDPLRLRDFCKQTLRWQRGFFQGVKKYHIGIGTQRIDVSIGFQLFQAILYIIQYWIFVPLYIKQTGNWMVIPVMLAADFIVMGLIAMFSMAATKRWNILGALPYFYILRWIELAIFFWAFFEVMLLGRYKNSPVGWSTSGRRYALSSQALQDTAR